MKKIAVVVCSFASIPQEIINHYGIIAIKPNFEWMGEEDLKGENIFQKMRDALSRGINSLPKTSQPSIGVFRDTFEKALEEAEDVLCLTISSKISGTYNSALQTKKFFSKEKQERIHLVDTYNIDVAETLLAIRALELAEQGKEIKEIVQLITEVVPKTYFFGMTENPKQMEAGGRINHVLAMALMRMQKLGMRPLLHMEEGLVKPANLKMNASNTAEVLFKHFKSINKELSKGIKYMIAISHADNLKEAQKLKELLKKEYPDQVEVSFISMTGVFIGSHVGPGTLMMCSIPKSSI